MKTSNKILLGLFATIFLSITSAFVDIRVFGEHNSERNRIKKTQDVTLGNYKYVKAINITSLEIRPANNNHLNFIAYHDSAVFSIDHQIVGDTLFLTEKNSQKYFSHYSLYSHSEIEFIYSKESKIELNGLKQQKLDIKLEGGQAFCYGSDSTRLSTFNNFSVEQINAQTNFHNTKIDTLDISLINSRAGFVKDVKVLSARLEEKSNLQLRNVDQVRFQKDKRSRIYFN